MASVWVARQRGKHGFEKLVAIKTILPKFADDLRFQEMFLDEARIAARIEHLNVAHIFDLGEENEILYLVMEYVDGDALSKLNRACQKKGVKIPAGVLLRVLADTCAGLHEAHELKDAEGKPLEIVHRDVSPHNILVSSKGIVKLIDFGIAKARSRAGSDTNSGVLKGKIQYMAPEQASGNPVDRRADLWAVGAILYHLLSGKPPYEGDNQLATLHLLGSGRPPVPLPPSVHPSISGIVRRALMHAPEKRFDTATEMHDAIERAMFDAKVTTTSASVAQFWAQHMSERATRRRQAIDFAIAAAADRKRVEEMLRPPGGERSSATGVTPAPVVASPAKAFEPLPSSSTYPAATPPQAVTPTSDALAKLTPRVSEPPSQVSSYATLGSAAIDASATVPLQPRQRRSAFPVIAGVVVAAVGIAVFSLAVLRPSPGEAPSASPASRPQGASPEVTAATLPGAPSSLAAAHEAGAAGSGSVAPSAPPLPSPKPAPPAAGAPPQQRWVAPTGGSKPRPAKTVDDGF
jgi:serine/threonine-protein kinase